MRLKKSSTFWQNISKKLIVPMGIIILLLVGVFLPGKLIKINKIECETQYGHCPDQLESGIRNLESGSLSKTKRQIKKTFEGNPLVSDYSIQFGFPDKLKINVVLKKPRFAILDKTSGKYLLLSAEGAVLAEVNETSLPTVVQEGSSPNFFALQIMEGIFTMYQVGRGEIVGKSLVVELATGVKVIFPLEGDREVLLGSLRLIYAKVQDKEIDLRFKNPILR